MGANICLPAALRPGRDRGAQLHLRGTSISELCFQAVAGTLPPASGCRCGFMGCRRTRQGHRSQSSRGCCSRGQGEAALPRALCVLQGGRGAEMDSLLSRFLLGFCTVTGICARARAACLLY